MSTLRSRFSGKGSALILAASLSIVCVGDAQAAPAPENGYTTGSPHRGGILHLTADASGGTLDPQINYTSEYIQLFVNMYDGLVTYRQADGTKGLDVVPDLAESLPEISADGLVWVFTLRENIRFSNGAPVTVDDVVASLRRIYRVGSPTASSFYGAIIGAKACLTDPAIVCSKG